MRSPRSQRRSYDRSHPTIGTRCQRLWLSAPTPAIRSSRLHSWVSLRSQGLRDSRRLDSDAIEHEPIPRLIGVRPFVLTESAGQVRSVRIRSAETLNQAWNPCCRTPGCPESLAWDPSMPPFPNRGAFQTFAPHGRVDSNSCQACDQGTPIQPGHRTPSIVVKGRHGIRLKTTSGSRHRPAARGWRARPRGRKTPNGVDYLHDARPQSARGLQRDRARTSLLHSVPLHLRQCWDMTI